MQSPILFSTASIDMRLASKVLVEVYEWEMLKLVVGRRCVFSSTGGICGKTALSGDLLYESRLVYNYFLMRSIDSHGHGLLRQNLTFLKYLIQWAILL